MPKECHPLVPVRDRLHQLTCGMWADEMGQQANRKPILSNNLIVHQALQTIVSCFSSCSSTAYFFLHLKHTHTKQTYGQYTLSTLYLFGLWNHPRNSSIIYFS